jgi:hypothetical protein
LLLFGFLLVNFLHHIHHLFILNSVPKSVTSYYNKVMILNIKACYLGLTNYYFAGTLLCLKISKSSRGWKSTRKNSQWPNDLVIVLSICLSDGCGLVYLSSSRYYSFLLLSVGGFVILRNLIKLFTTITPKNGSWVSKISCVASIFINKDNQCTASAIISFLFPLLLSHQKRFSHCIRNIFFPV